MRGKQGWFWSLMFLILSASAGCATCASPMDYAYSAYGGRWQRADMFHGRVGSAFAPAGAMSEAPLDQPPSTTEVIDEDTYYYYEPESDGTVLVNPDDGSDSR